MSSSLSHTPIPNLYISDITVPSSPVQLEEHGFTHVLTLLTSSYRPNIPASLGINHKVIELDDDVLADLLAVLEEACTFISDGLEGNKDKTEGEEKGEGEGGGKVLVHCLQGVSRSGAVIVGYLMKTLDLSYPSALTLAWKDRSVIAPNQGFREQLKLWREMGFGVWEENGKEKEGYRAWTEKRDKAVKGMEEEMERWEDWKGVVGEEW